MLCTLAGIDAFGRNGLKFCLHNANIKTSYPKFQPNPSSRKKMWARNKLLKLGTLMLIAPALSSRRDGSNLESKKWPCNINVLHAVSALQNLWGPTSQLGTVFWEQSFGNKVPGTVFQERSFGNRVLGTVFREQLIRETTPLRSR